VNRWLNDWHRTRETCNRYEKRDTYDQYTRSSVALSKSVVCLTHILCQLYVLQVQYLLFVCAYRLDKILMQAPITGS